MAFAFYAPVFLPAFLIVVLEMTEVVALVFALGGHERSMRPSVYGAVTGTVVVSAIGLGAGAALRALPTVLLLAASATVLAGFGVFLFFSTTRSYRRARTASAGTQPAASPEPHRSAQFAGGFSVGSVETTEAVIVLLALAAPQPAYATTVLLGAVVGGAALVGAAALLHGHIRRIKVPVLKLGATSLLFTFAAFWGAEALGVSWPGGDLFLVPLFVLAVVLVRGTIGALMARVPIPVETKG